LRSNIDYALAEAQTVYGKIGIKVWLCKGEIYGKVDLSPQTETDRKGSNNRGNDRRDRGGRDRRDRRRNNA
jgi:small subunit ribosomal protein S3